MNYLFEFVEDGIIINHHFEPHKRGRNWVSKISGKNSVSFERESIKFRGNKVSTEGFAIGDALELGGDYISGGGVRHPDRGYYLITGITDQGVEVEIYSSIATLLKAKNKKKED